ncbi:fibronectin type III domain-containing protein [Flagellimonas hymeniacidonis]|uniref:Fibronectin type III domain-containing protein n=1 Tax=Flagellimonas hymeniacidonis TaxID=2603628 RepID=A0A5C8V3J0_9FLAO|nr:fibronectin type III domain-containing protein [Flagellimonas hymeniacidonis]TXN36140.1 fibronectin type III domain-containing protein [Flagellimonas hymeniacidonis]
MKNVFSIFPILILCILPFKSVAQNTYTYQLIDAANNSVLVPSFNNNFTWNLNEASILNVASNLTTSGIAYQVRFTTSEYTKTEGAIPYAYRGDSSGDYDLAHSWSPSVGDLSFTVEYLDSSLNVFAVDNFTITFVNTTTDSQAPTAPTLSSTAQTDTTVDLSWSEATDNTGVTGYKIFKDGALEATLGNVNTHQVTGLTASTAYSFTATALDAATNESVVSNAVSVTTDSSGGGSSGGGNSVWTETSSVASYTGDVAVGTSTVPTGYKMAIDGKLITEEVKVQLSGNWPDYVFAKDYELPTLEEIQKYIKEKGHLPDIPSAKEVEENGIQLGEMNRLLLEKIEELTLYILQQQREIEQLKQKQ